MDNLRMVAAAGSGKSKIIRWIFNGVSLVGEAKIQFMRHRKHFMSITRANRLMYRTNSSTDFRGFTIRGIFKIRRFAPRMTRQEMCVLHNIEALSCNHCCSGQASSITYFNCVFVGLGIPAYNVHAPFFNLCPARMYNIFPHYLINNKIFEKKLPNINCLLWFSLQHCLQHFSY
jgi:hypothetical protein